MSYSPSAPSLVSGRSSRASSPFATIEVAEPPVKVKEPIELGWTRHPRYHFEDGSVTFLVEDTIYSVHRYFFARDAIQFSTIFPKLRATDDKNPLVLCDVSGSDFDEFLTVLYPTDFSDPAEKTTVQWTSVLHLATKWGFESIKRLAIKNLTAAALPVDKIVLRNRYDILEWLPSACEAVCTRADSSTMEEGSKLGLETALRISAVRQAYGCGKARYDTKHLKEDLAGIFGTKKTSDADEETDRDEDAVMILRGEVEKAQEALLALPTPPMGDCHPTGGWGRCGECDGCKPESKEQRCKREDKEDKERRLKEFQDRRKDEGSLVEMQNRISFFR